MDKTTSLPHRTHSRKERQEQDYSDFYHILR